MFPLFKTPGVWTSTFVLFLFIMLVTIPLLIFPQNQELLSVSLEKALRETPIIDVHCHGNWIKTAIEMRVLAKGDIWHEYGRAWGMPAWTPNPANPLPRDIYVLQGCRVLFGFEGPDLSGDNGRRALSLAMNFMKDEAAAYRFTFEKTGVEHTLLNISHLTPEMQSLSSVHWVPYADPFLFPFNNEPLKDASLSRRFHIDFFEACMRRYRGDRNPLKGSLQDYLQFIRDNLTVWRQNGVPAIKFWLAYTRTLRFEPVEFSEAETLFHKGKGKKKLSPSEYRRFQDFIARFIFAEAGKQQLPVHIHTGVGVTLGLQISESSPLNLENIISCDEFKQTRFLLLHGGYPFTRELTALLQHPNVYAEFSEINWILHPSELSEILKEWIRVPGLNEKILFATDASFPIWCWIAVENSRAALKKAFLDLIQEGVMNEQQALRAIRNILRDNALRLHPALPR